MPKATARLTSKNRLVLPQEVRKQLNVGPGDGVVFSYGVDGVRIEKAPPQDDPCAIFAEWASAADDDAFRDL
ncbi:MAG: AbrB/MazE/SpoVT family DNA-binding domain-containing protein [Hyphomonadaceae bacterium]